MESIQQSYSLGLVCSGSGSGSGGVTDDTGTGGNLSGTTRVETGETGGVRSGMVDSGVINTIGTILTLGLLYLPGIFLGRITGGAT
jgi:hypothetical protein